MLFYLNWQEAHGVDYLTNCINLAMEQENDAEMLRLFEILQEVERLLDLPNRNAPAASHCRGSC